MEQDGGAPRVGTSSVVVASTNQVSTALGEQAVILGADAGKYFGLDQVGARVWELVQKPTSVGALCATICGEYEVDGETCERDVLELLNELSSNGLLDVREPSGS
jgi:hypothetical protein